MAVSELPAVKQLPRVSQQAGTNILLFFLNSNIFRAV